ncbi:hypothetical protein FRC16_004240, partial [Serendipita sp. 398]
RPVKGINVKHAEPSELEEGQPRQVTRAGKTTGNAVETKPGTNTKPRRSGRQRAY